MQGFAGNVKDLNLSPRGIVETGQLIHAMICILKM